MSTVDELIEIVKSLQETVAMQNEGIKILNKRLEAVEFQVFTKIGRQR